MVLQQTHITCLNYGFCLVNVLETFSFISFLFAFVEKALAHFGQQNLPEPYSP